MIALLKIVQGLEGDCGRSAAIGATAVEIGRAPEARLRLQDPNVSRLHCKVAVVGGMAEVTDAGSSTGTFVNGNPVQQQQLLDGDMIRVGNTEIQFFWSNADEKSTVSFAAPSID